MFLLDTVKNLLVVNKAVVEMLLEFSAFLIKFSGVASLTSDPFAFPETYLFWR